MVHLMRKSRVLRTNCNFTTTTGPADAPPEGNSRYLYVHFIPPTHEHYPRSSPPCAVSVCLQEIRGGGSFKMHKFCDLQP